MATPLRPDSRSKSLRNSLPAMSSLQGLNSSVSNSKISSLRFIQRELIQDPILRDYIKETSDVQTPSNSFKNIAVPDSALWCKLGMPADVNASRLISSGFNTRLLERDKIGKVEEKTAGEATAKHTRRDVRLMGEVEMRLLRSADKGWCSIFFELVGTQVARMPQTCAFQDGAMVCWWRHGKAGAFECVPEEYLNTENFSRAVLRDLGFKDVEEPQNLDEILFARRSLSSLGVKTNFLTFAQFTRLMVNDTDRQRTLSLQMFVNTGFKPSQNSVFVSILTQIGNIGAQDVVFKQETYKRYRVTVTSGRVDKSGKLRRTTQMRLVTCQDNPINELLQAIVRSMHLKMSSQRAGQLHALYTEFVFDKDGRPWLLWACDAYNCPYLELHMKSMVRVNSLFAFSPKVASHHLPQITLTLHADNDAKEAGVTSAPRAVEEEAEALNEGDLGAADPVVKTTDLDVSNISHLIKKHGPLGALKHVISYGENVGLGATTLCMTAISISRHQVEASKESQGTVNKNSDSSLRIFMSASKEPKERHKVDKQTLLMFVRSCVLFNVRFCFRITFCN
jgi:hypothetical protein